MSAVRQNGHRRGRRRQLFGVIALAGIIGIPLAMLVGADSGFDIPRAMIPIALIGGVLIALLVSAAADRDHHD